MLTDYAKLNGLNPDRIWSNVSIAEFEKEMNDHNKAKKERERKNKKKKNQIITIANEMTRVGMGIRWSGTTLKERICQRKRRIRLEDVGAVGAVSE